MIEKLTDDERGALHWYGKEANRVGQKALRIIDQLTEALAAAERAHEQALNERDSAHGELEKIIDPREGSHRNEIQRLQQVNRELLSTRHAAEAALAAESVAKSEWERLRNEAYSLYRAEALRRETAEARVRELEAKYAPIADASRRFEQQLAGANALLRRVPRNTVPSDTVKPDASQKRALDLTRDIDAHLTAQFAAPAVYIPVHVTVKAASEAEIKAAVLKALETPANAALQARVEELESLVRDWSNFDFDCPDECDPETDEEHEDGWALERLYERTAELLAPRDREAKR